MHHGPAERPAVAAWLYGYRARCVESAVFHALASYGLVIRTFSHGRTNENNPGGSIHCPIVYVLRIAFFRRDFFHFCGSTKHVNSIMSIVRTIVLHSRLYNQWICHFAYYTFKLIYMKSNKWLLHHYVRYVNMCQLLQKLWLRLFIDIFSPRDVLLPCRNFYRSFILSNISVFVSLFLPFRDLSWDSCHFLKACEYSSS